MLSVSTADIKKEEKYVVNSHQGERKKDSYEGKYLLRIIKQVTGKKR